MKNYSIKCSVKDCKYNDTKDEYCVLPEIKVGATDKKTKTCQGTECDSFECKY